MADATQTGIPTQLGHVALRVRDVDSAVEWYTNVLGLTLKNRMRGIAFLGIREDASHEVALMPLPPEAVVCVGGLLATVGCVPLDDQLPTKKPRNRPKIMPTRAKVTSSLFMMAPKIADGE